MKKKTSRGGLPRRRQFAVRHPVLGGVALGRLALAGLSSLAFSQAAFAGGVQTLDKIPEVEITDTTAGLIGTADTANEGTVLKEQLEQRPVYRPGELLETVPGLIVTQHSGEGKANQYFLRGFNLDHGTDIEINMDDMPVNMRSHAHGQGYADLNFMIPELVDNLQYSKGPYYAAGGEFDTAGSVHINLLDKLDHDIAAFSMGTLMDDRAFGAMSRPVAGGNVIVAGEYSHVDGPSTIPDNFNKGNAFIRYSQGTANDGFSVTGMYLKDEFHSTDQVPRRAVSNGLINPYDAIDPTDGGLTERYSLSAKFAHQSENGMFKANTYFIGYNFHLFNNFDYFLDPVHGDQFGQFDHRHIYGGSAAYTSFDKLFGLDTQNTYGFQFRDDDIHTTLALTQNQAQYALVRDDSVTETSAGIYFENKTQWLEKFRTVAGLRQDIFYASDASNLAANTGTTAKGMFSPKGSFIFGPWSDTELYLSAGDGFHSNDARGALTTVVPPNSPGGGAFAAQGKTSLLTRAQGYEVGVRSTVLPHLQTEMSVFDLEIADETIFNGDTGTTSQTGRPSRRLGVEFSNFYKPFSWLILDGDIAFTRARFTNADDGLNDVQPGHTGSYIPEAAKIIASAGLTVTDQGPWEGGLRFRYFGPRPLIEDGSVRSGPTTLVDARIGYKLTESVTAQVDIFNIFASSAHQIDYYYQSQLRGEALPVYDIHYKPVEPPSARFTVKMIF